MSTPESTAAIVYVGPPNAGLGWRLAGIATDLCDTSEQLLENLRRRAREGGQGILYVDEVLAEPILDDIEQLNEQGHLAIVLVASPLGSRQVAAQKMDRLMVRAIGSDIFSD